MYKLHICQKKVSNPLILEQPPMPPASSTVPRGLSALRSLWGLGGVMNTF